MELESRCNRPYSYRVLIGCSWWCHPLYGPSCHTDRYTLPYQWRSQFAEGWCSVRQRTSILKWERASMDCPQKTQFVWVIIVAIDMHLLSPVVFPVSVIARLYFRIKSRSPIWRFWGGFVPKGRHAFLHLLFLTAPLSPLLDRLLFLQDTL